MVTVKQKLAVKKVLKGTPIKTSMLEVGYAPSTAKTTGKLTRSKGWLELVEKHISDKALAKVHEEGLKAVTYFTEGLGKGETVLVEKPDYSVRHKYLESGYKLKGRYPKDPQPEGGTTNNFVQININPPHGSIEHQSNRETIPSMAGSSES